jgi:hypothetical protein
MNKPTLVLGASLHSERYSYKAIQLLQQYEHTVYAVGAKKGRVGDINIEDSITDIDEIHTVTLYLNPQHQQQYVTEILALQPKRVIFNPGTENPALLQLLTEAGIPCMEACTLVMLRTGQY